MKFKHMIFKARTFLEGKIKYPAYLILLGLISGLSVSVIYLIHLNFSIFDSPTITYGFWLSYAITLIGMASFISILLFFLFTSSVSPEEKLKLSNEIHHIRKELDALQSDNWLEPVKQSLGDKFPRISSQQRLIDERNRLIRNREYYLKTIEELVKC
ncbi:hypothetical protein [Scandinavium goeteborgense]|uniref:Uncharacterized protein n=1 Tax=Scandinavium goeteborgense TaxID=1851514 RepID=A0A4R6DU15_SCAGO|nr:hypothetical protein [Scandinavium goeteborgense]TDN48089.1 hypothetical protein EC847_12840 [Scandinavium goeteborgense]